MKALKRLELAALRGKINNKHPDSPEEQAKRTTIDLFAERLLRDLKEKDRWWEKFGGSIVVLPTGSKTKTVTVPKEEPTP